MDDKLAEFYASPEWKKKIKEIQARDGYQCQACGCSKKDVSHLSVRDIYPLRKWIAEGKDPLKYPDEWFVTICLIVIQQLIDKKVH